MSLRGEECGSTGAGSEFQHGVYVTTRPAACDQSPRVDGIHCHVGAIQFRHQRFKLPGEHHSGRLRPVDDDGKRRGNQIKLFMPGK